MSARTWCFTLNNPDGLLDVEFEQWDGLRYAIYQHEVGQEGTEHFQGYIELDRVARLSKMISMIPGAHFEVRRGTREQARDYCRKEESRLDGPWEYGAWEAGGQGARADVASFKAAVDSGATDLELWDTQPNMYLRYQRMLNNIRSLKEVKRNWKTEVIFLYGPPGTGKTNGPHGVRRLAPDAYFHNVAMGSWFENYKGEEEVILDEFCGWVPFHVLLQMMDEGPCKLQGKCLSGGVNWIAKKLYITSNQSPREWYGKKDDEDDRKRKYPLAAFTRRVTSWKVFLPGIGFTPQTPYDEEGNWNVIIKDFNNQQSEAALEFM